MTRQRIRVTSTAIDPDDTADVFVPSAAPVSVTIYDDEGGYVRLLWVPQKRNYAISTDEGHIHIGSARR